MRRNRPGVLRLTANQSKRRNLAFIEGLAGRPIDELRAATPPAPQPRAPRKPSGTTPERLILAAIIKALRYHPRVAFVHRMQSGVFQEGNRTIRVGSKGLPDLIGMLKGGTFFGVEVKSETGRVSEDQSRHISLITSNGGKAGVARSVDDALAIINAN